jgi:hypothetical protein
MAFKSRQMVSWLWLLVLTRIGSAEELRPRRIDAEIFEKRALQPGIFIVACMFGVFPNSSMCLINLADLGLDSLHGESDCHWKYSDASTTNPLGMVNHVKILETSLWMQTRAWSKPLKLMYMKRIALKTMIFVHQWTSCPFRPSVSSMRDNGLDIAGS